MRTTNGQTGRRRTATDKVKILEEARAPNTTVAEVLRRHQLDSATYYRWEREAKAAVLAALGDQPRVAPDALARENERLRAELAKKSRIIAEVVEENLGLKGGL
jgi:transposase-like protein